MASRVAPPGGVERIFSEKSATKRALKSNLRRRRKPALEWGLFLAVPLINRPSS